MTRVNGRGGTHVYCHTTGRMYRGGSGGSVAGMNAPLTTHRLVSSPTDQSVVPRESDRPKAPLFSSTRMKGFINAVHYPIRQGVQLGIARIVMGNGNYMGRLV